MKKFAVSVCVIALLVLTAADSLRGVDRARELADFEHEDRGLNSEGMNAKYDQALESREDARALEEYEQYYRALEEQLRFLEDEENEDDALDKVDDMLDNQLWDKNMEDMEQKEDENGENDDQEEKEEIDLGDRNLDK